MNKMDTVNNNVDGILDRSKIMSNITMKEMQEQLNAMKAKVAELESKGTRRVTNDVVYRFTGRVTVDAVAHITVEVGDKMKFLAPQAQCSLRAACTLRDQKIADGAASGTITFTREEWGVATKEDPKWMGYRQTGERINDYYHHQFGEYNFLSMEIDGVMLFS